MFAGFAALETGPIVHLMPTRLTAVLRPAPRLVRKVLQLSVPIALTLIAFPALAHHGQQVLSAGGSSAAMLLAVLFCAVAGIVLSTAPAPGEPNVHDRQLDVILAVFFIGGCVWFTTAWPEQFGAGQSLTGQQIIAATALLTGIYLLVAGTRLTARLRFVLILPLIATPQITERPTVLTALVAVTIAATLLLVAVRFRRSTRIAASSVTAESAKKSAQDFLLLPAPVEHQAPTTDTAAGLDHTPPAPSTAPRATSSTPQNHATRALATETGPTR